MGIKGLFSLAKNVCKKKKLSDFSGCKIAMDAMCYIFQIKYSCSGDAFRRRSAKLFNKFASQNIELIIVLDGDGADIAKTEESERRRARRQAQRDNASLLGDSLRKYYESGVIEERLAKAVLRLRNLNKEKNTDALFGLTNSPSKSRSLSCRSISQSYSLSSDIENPVMLVGSISKNEIRKLEHRVATLMENGVAQEDIDIFCEEAYKSGFSVVESPDEAERYCAYMWKNGVVDAVLSEDSDVLAFGVSPLITKFTMKKAQVDVICSIKLREHLGLPNENDFAAFCVLCGCDFYRPPKYFGQKTALKYATSVEEEGDLLNPERLQAIPRFGVSFDSDNIEKLKIAWKFFDPNFDNLSLLAYRDRKLPTMALKKKSKKKNDKMNDRDIQKLQTNLLIAFMEDM